MFEKLRRTPKNPGHFVALCMLELKDNPNLASSRGIYMSKVREIKGRGVFQTAYGYFWVTNGRKTSKEFYPTMRDLFNAFKNITMRCSN